MIKNNKLEKLEKQMNLLLARKKRVENKRTQEFMKIMNRCGIDKLPHEVLAGALLEAARAYGKKDSRVMAWEAEGRKVLKPGRGKKKLI
jgi:hypothetical protein